MEKTIWTYKYDAGLDPATNTAFALIALANEIHALRIELKERHENDLKGIKGIADEIADLVNATQDRR